VAVNLSGIELGGTTMAPARKTSASPSTPAASQDASASQTGDVSITSTAALLAQLEQSLASQPAVDDTRVEALRQAISSGTYAVSADKIASGLIGTEHALSALPLAEI
jgi:negative regulator of flagellin synthesis FlgM